MCRIAGYLGVPVALRALLDGPPHSLRAQAKQPRDLPPGVVGSDGHGVGWFADGVAEPARVRSILPIWNEENIDTMSGQIRSSSIVASSRTATRRMPVAISNTPPFLAGDALVVHNGSIADFHESVMEGLRQSLGADARRDVQGNTDSEYLAALLGERSEIGLPDRVRGLIAMVTEHVERARVTAQLCLIVAERDTLVIARHAIGDRAPTLRLLVTGHGVTAASEPMDDRDWEDLDTGDLVTARFDGAFVSVERARL